MPRAWDRPQERGCGSPEDLAAEPKASGAHEHLLATWAGIYGAERSLGTSRNDRFGVFIGKQIFQEDPSIWVTATGRGYLFPSIMQISAG